MSENITPKVKAVMDVYGWETLAEMGQAPEWKDAMLKCGNDKNAALKYLANFQQDMPGWLLGPAKSIKREGGKTVVDRIGAAILTYDGQKRNIFDGEDWSEAKPGTKIVGGPFKARINLKNPEKGVKVTASKETKIVEQDHDHPFPSVDAGWIVNRALEKSDDDFDNGCIRGKSRGFFTGELGDASDMFVNLKDGDGRYPVEFDSVSAIVSSEGTDDNGEPVTYEFSVKIPAQDIAAQFDGYDITKEDPEDTKELLENEIVACNGTYSALQSFDFYEAKGDKQPGPWGEDATALRSELQALLKTNYVKEVGNKGTIVLDLSSDDKADHLQIAGCDVYRASRTVDRDGNGVWNLEMLATDVKRNPWFSVRESPPKEKGGRPWNEGAFVLFVNRLFGDGNLPSANVLTDEELDMLPDIEA